MKICVHSFLKCQPVSPKIRILYEIKPFSVYIQKKNSVDRRPSSKIAVRTLEKARRKRKTQLDSIKIRSSIIAINSNLYKIGNLVIPKPATDRDRNIRNIEVQLPKSKLARANWRKVGRETRRSCCTDSRGIYIRFY